MSAITSAMLSSEREFTFDTIYRVPQIDPYNSFVSTEGCGIPRYVRLFDNFEPQNTTYPTKKFEKFRCASLLEYYHLADYLSAPELSTVLRTRQYDSVVNAIVSLILSWRSADREEFGKLHPAFDTFARAVNEFARQDDGAYVYAIEFENTVLAYCKCAFKLIKCLCPETAGATTTTSLTVDAFANRAFELSHYLDVRFINHLHGLYKQLSDESLSLQDIARLEGPFGIPFKLERRIGNYEKLRRTASVKFITGQACAGKTTLLNRLAGRGWIIMSRGKIGGFSGKADNPVAVAALHASTEFVMRHSNVLGDRSTIDNPLWVAIMELCDPKYERDLVWQLLRFLNANLNEATIGYYMNQRGVVFIDPYPSICAARMMARGTGGDAYRCRLDRYAIVQAVAYYTVARLFGWKLYCVPYTPERKFEPSRYGAIADELLDAECFGLPSDRNPLPVSCYNQPINNWTIDATYPKSVGIYK